MAERIGRYVVFEQIAAGGMATVHLSRLFGPLGFRRTLAAKKLRKELASAELALMLVDEARLGARVQHPNVVQTVDVVSEGGELVVFMEHVLGESLARLMARARRSDEPIDVAVANAIAVDVLRGLHAAHEATDEAGGPLGIVHRDVSPHNVLVGVDGVARVADFGVAKALGRVQTTRDGQVKGKLAYMAPEQMRGEGVDRRTDLFAAGIVVWELLTSERLFGGEDDKTTIGRVLMAEVSPPSKHRAEIPPSLDEAVLQALARDPSARYPDALAFAEALTRAAPVAKPADVGRWVESLCNEEVAARRRAIAAVEREVDPESVPSTSEEPTRSVAAEPAVRGEANAVSPSVPDRRRNVAAWVLGAAGAVGAAVASAFLIGREPASAAATGDTVSTPARSANEVPVSAPASAPRPAVEPAAPPIASATSTAAASASAPAVPIRSYPPSKPAVNCANPYTYDADGRKRYRRECLVK